MIALRMTICYYNVNSACSAGYRGKVKLINPFRLSELFTIQNELVDAARNIIST